MKTLDEVIEGIEACRDSYVAGKIIKDDALHYLKAFRDAKDTLEAEKDRYAEAVRNCEQAENRFRKMEDELNDIRRKHIEQMKKDPLTWDELTQMEGKPVWVEQPYQKMWGLNDGTYVDAFGNDCITIKVLHDLCHFEKNLMGKTWNAYRKERK